MKTFRSLYFYQIDLADRREFHPDTFAGFAVFTVDTNGFLRRKRIMNCDEHGSMLPKFQYLTI
jgi:hypothetical protein